MLDKAFHTYYRGGRRPLEFFEKESHPGDLEKLLLSLVMQKDIVMRRGETASMERGQ